MYTRENDGIFEPQRIMPHLFSQNAARESNFTSCHHCTSFYHLSNCEISACGTNKTNRKYFPKEMLLPTTTGLNQGESVWAAYKSMIALTWKDRKPVSFISTIHDPDLGNTVTRRQKIGGPYREMEITR